LYSWGGTQPESVGYAGENTIAAILASSDREISLVKYKKNRPLNIIIASKLKDIGLIEDFEVKAISKHRQEYEVKVRTKGSVLPLDLPDVGFGVSQVLPVLVQCFYAPLGSIIIMEQPELHLHPSAQAI
jgi:predicted ATPase